MNGNRLDSEGPEGSTLVIHAVEPVLVDLAFHAAEHGHHVLVVSPEISPANAVRSLLCGLVPQQIRRFVRAVMPVSDSFLPIPILIDGDGFDDILDGIVAS
jgi:hypothetical protein